MRLLTCIDALAQTSDATQMLEHLIKPLATMVNPALGAQLDSLEKSLSAVRTTVTAGVPQPLQTYAASVLAVAAAAPAQKQAAQQAVQAALSGLVQSFVTSSGLYDQLAAAQLQLYDLSVRYQNCVSSVVSWTLWVAGQLANDAPSLVDLVKAVNAAAAPLAIALDAVSDKGKALYSYVQSDSALSPLFGTVFAPLNSLPRPAAGASITELLDDTRSVMAAGAAVVSNVQNRAALAVSEVQSLVQSKNLAELISKLPVPSKVSFSYTWHPKIKSFEPVFLLESGADFSITAKFEEDVLKPGLPAMR